MNPALAAANFRKVLAQALPRILTQACRDPNSPSFGCFDRNFWHYRMRDFSSIILQQGGYTALRASEAVPDFLPGCFARELAAGSAKFWNRRAVMHGAFEEYYPWEQGYPPVAFSTLAVAKLVAEGVVDKDAVRPGMKRAARQLLARFEDKATNQQVAGLAALAWIRKSYPESVPEAGFARQKAKTLAKQHEEGWFWEYDGPDAGYLSVTMDCLWDLWDATGDPDFRDSCNRALAFLDTAVGKPGCGLGMLNARNTDYVVPYGIARYLNDGAPEQRRTAGRLIDALYSGAGEAAHFFAAVDDRYWCHYIGHSVARAVAQFDKAAARSPAETLPPESGRAAADVFLPGCGYAFRRLPDETLLTVAANKGGCLRLSKHGKVLAADFGWVVKTREKQFVSHWWSTDWKTKRTAGGYEISGRLAPHREMESTPFKHFGLRVVSYLFGKSVIGLLKKNLIFKKTESPYGFKRVVAVGEDGSVLVDDSISGLTGAESVLPAPRASKRHVASADSFHAEDAALIADGVSFSRETHSGGGTFRAKTKVAFENP